MKTMVKKFSYWLSFICLTAMLMVIFKPGPAYPEAIVQYLYLTNYEQTRYREIIWFWGFDTLRGVYRSNDYFGLKNGIELRGDGWLVTAKDQFMTNDDNYDDSRTITNAPVYQFPDLSYLADSADYVVGDDGYVTRLHFDGEDGIRVTLYRQGIPPEGEYEENDVDEVIDIDEPTIIYTEHPCEVYGIVAGNITLYCDENIYLLDDIRYEGSDEQDGSFDQENMNHMLALVSEKNVIIANTSRNGRDDGYGQYEWYETDKHSIVINGSIVALDESFTFQQHNDDWEPYQGPTPDERGIIHLTGGVAQYRRGYLHRSNHSGTGYGKDFNWDTRLDQRVPPGFKAGLVTDLYRHCPVLNLPGGQYQIMPYQVHEATVGEMYIDAPPNVAFRFSEGSRLTIEDTISIRATPTDNVVFFSDEEGFYADIYFEGNSDIKNATFWSDIRLHFGAGIHVLDSCTIQGTIDYGGDLTIRNSTIEADIFYELAGRNQSLTLENCKFCNGGYPQRVVGLGDMWIRGCEFAEITTIQSMTLDVAASNFHKHATLYASDTLTVDRSLFLAGLELLDRDIDSGSVKNCLMTDSDGAGLIGILSPQLTIRNNIITGNNRGIVAENDAASLMYNDVFDNGDFDYVNCQPGEGSISEDPLFVSAENGDYHLAWGSPCIDAGDPYSPLDPDGSYIEIGPYYYDHELSVDEKPSFVPDKFGLSAYPNPFNSKVMINFDLLPAVRGKLLVFDVIGRLVLTRQLERSMGTLPMPADVFGNDGIYFLQLVSDSEVKTIKVLYLK